MEPYRTFTLYTSRRTKKVRRLIYTMIGVCIAIAFIVWGWSLPEV